MERIPMELSQDERKMVLALRKGGPLDVIDILKELMPKYYPDLVPKIIPIDSIRKERKV